MSGQQGGDDKNSMAILWMIAGVFFVLAALWWGFSEQIKVLFINIRLLQLNIIYLVVKWLPFEDTIDSVEDALTFMRGMSTGTLSLPTAELISVFVGEFLRWPICLILVLFSYITYIKSVTMRYKKRYDMELLAAQESIEWPQINPVIPLNLVKTDLDEGPWAMSMPPLIFCKKNKLLTVSLDTSGDLFKKGPKFKAVLNEVRAEKVFSSQLGRVFKSPENMPIHRRALLASFIARGCRDTDSARKLMYQINSSCKKGDINNLDFTGADELWKKHYNSREVQEIVQVHAYEFTIFTSLFLFARSDGVFPCSDFMWLKPKDRQLWYVLNNVGRQTPCCEAAGAHAHFLAEKNLNRKLSVPVVKEAVVALQIALDELVYIPSDEEKDKLFKEAEEAGK